MPHITFILGNGFDLNQGLKTRYTDFYPHYIKTNVCEYPELNLLQAQTFETALEKFKRELSKSDVLWSDFELSLGKYSQSFNSQNEAYLFTSMLDDFTSHFAMYLKKQDERIIFSDTQKIEASARKLHADLVGFQKYIENIGAELSRLIRFDLNTYAVVSLNYTNWLPQLFSRIRDLSNIQGVYSLHGKLSPNIPDASGNGNSNILIGVGDKAQIRSPYVQRDLSSQHIVKNDALQSPKYRNQYQEVNNHLSRSDVIIIFGCSIGPTDLHIWKQVASRLQRNHTYVIVFDRVSEIPLRTQYNLNLEENKRQQLKDNFKLYAGTTLSDDQLKRLHIEFNPNAFKLDLPKLEKVSASATGGTQYAG